MDALCQVSSFASRHLCSFAPARLVTMPTARILPSPVSRPGQDLHEVPQREVRAERHPARLGKPPCCDIQTSAVPKRGFTGPATLPQSDSPTQRLGSLALLLSPLFPLRSSRPTSPPAPSRPLARSWLASSSSSSSARPSSRSSAPPPAAPSPTPNRLIGDVQSLSQRKYRDEETRDEDGERAGLAPRL